MAAAVAALIIAGGKTSLGGVFEPEKESGTIPAIRRIVMIFRRAGIERVVVACGGSDGKTEKLAAFMNGNL